MKKDLSVAIDPDVLAAFKKSSLVSSKYLDLCYLFLIPCAHFIFALVGKSATGASLLKVGSKRKRTKREIAEDKAQTQLKEEQIAQKLQHINSME